MKNYARQFPGYYLILIPGFSSFSYPLITILFNVQNITTKWSFWIPTQNTSLFHWKNFTKRQWQNTVPTLIANVPDFISCLLHTKNINEQEAYDISKIHRRTPAKIYQKSSIRHACMAKI